MVFFFFSFEMRKSCQTRLEEARGTPPSAQRQGQLHRRDACSWSLFCPWMSPALECPGPCPEHHQHPSPWAGADVPNIQSHSNHFSFFPRLLRTWRTDQALLYIVKIVICGLLAWFSPASAKHRPFVQSPPAGWVFQPRCHPRGCLFMVHIILRSAVSQTGHRLLLATYQKLHRGSRI